MKCKAAIAALMLALGLSSTSFGATLLDQMLGLRSRGHGCCAPACCEPKCCPAPVCEPTCCPAPVCEPTCCPAPVCEPKCCPAPACEPTCCPAPVCEPKCCPAHECGCEPACCEPVCCKPKRCKKRTSLLELIFGNRRKCCKPACVTTCCVSACATCGHSHDGYHGNGAPAPAVDDGAPVPPAPMVDPAAYNPGQRRVVHAGVNLLR